MTYNILTGTAGQDKINVYGFQNPVDESWGLYFNGVAQGAASGSTLGYQHVGGRTIITGELGETDLAITLRGIVTLDASDFIFSQGYASIVVSI